VRIRGARIKSATVKKRMPSRKHGKRIKLKSLMSTPSWLRLTHVSILFTSVLVKEEILRKKQQMLTRKKLKLITLRQLLKTLSRTRKSMISSRQANFKKLKKPLRLTINVTRKARRNVKVLASSIMRTTPA